MAGDTRLLNAFFQIAVAFFSLELNKKVHGYYCRSDWCNYNEYCCGFDECCSYLTGYWYLWLVGGVMLFSFLMVCFWMRYRRKAKEASYQNMHNQPHGYVMYGTTQYGDPIFVRQQPTSHQYQGPVPTQTPYISTSNKGNIPLEEARQRQAAAVQPPPYDYSERRTPSAPPYNN